MVVNRIQGTPPHFPNKKGDNKNGGFRHCIFRGIDNAGCNMGLRKVKYK